MKLKYEIVKGVLPFNDYISTMQVKAGPGAGEATVTWLEEQNSQPVTIIVTTDALARRPDGRLFYLSPLNSMG